MRKNIKKILIIVAVIVIVAIIAFILSLQGTEDFHEKYAGTDLTRDVEGMERAGTYTGYLNEHVDARDMTCEAEINLFDYTSTGTVEVYTNYEGTDKALFTDTDSSVSFHVQVPQTGYYNLYMEYLIPESRGVAAERGVRINGEFPFEDAQNITFTRIWTDGGEVKTDNQGNQIRPTQIEVYDWQSSRFEDDMGYITEPYRFYFEKGDNEITLEAENEPMIIRKFMVAPVSVIHSYEEYAAKNPDISGQASADYIQTIQGEDSTLRSESSLYAKYDRSSPTTYPNSVTNTVLNYVGGDTWRSSGQWIEWEFEVPEDGYYNIMIKGRQNYSRGSVSSRTVYIDGEIPFSEMKEISYAYSNDWECKDLADENGVPYNFYLTKGTHTIRLEATLGGVGPILEELEDSTYRVNQIYRKILVYTGANPDRYRDYYIEANYPEVMEAMELESKRLFKIVDDTVSYSGQKADNIAAAQTVAQQMERFCEKPNKITLEFTTFKDNITALGTASLNMSETKLDIDYLVISGTGVTPKKDKANIFMKLWHETKSFFASFFVDIISRNL